eukprot:TRINITY_DN20928_c0_g1_i2.p1 TRINITY_DN20928_c0_g1~~TRINITY_DN20928_c0_g1_i2.p1  ORF type:complete len:106 (+),score=21.25 TRINITY_DN20928_c0_g1_i2:51-368(+)
MEKLLQHMQFVFFFFQAEDGIRDVERSRGLGDVYKRQVHGVRTPLRLGNSAILVSSSTAVEQVISKVQHNYSYQKMFKRHYRVPNVEEEHLKLVDEDICLSLIHI